LPTTENL